MHILKIKIGQGVFRFKLSLLFLKKVINERGEPSLYSRIMKVKLKGNQLQNQYSMR